MTDEQLSQEEIAAVEALKVSDQPKFRVVQIEVELHKTLKMKATQEGKTIKQLAEELIAKGLSQ